MYKVKSPVLLIVFNRPILTEKIIQKIREARPSRLYISADGPRDNVINEKKLLKS